MMSAQGSLVGFRPLTSRTLTQQEDGTGVLWGLSYKGMNPINFKVHVISNLKLYSRLKYLSSSGRGKLRK